MKTLALTVVHFRPILPETGPEYVFGRPVECILHEDGMKVRSYLEDGRRYVVRCLFYEVTERTERLFLSNRIPTFETSHDVEVFTP